MNRCLFIIVYRIRIKVLLLLLYDGHRLLYRCFRASSKTCAMHARLFSKSIPDIDKDYFVFSRQYTTKYEILEK